MELEIGDVVLCTVDRIVGTTVFVKIEGNGEGNIIISEIAPGRIRNLREYVVPKKKIVCKILRISEKGIPDLSLRRVTQKEKKEVLEQYKQEKNYKSFLKNILKEKAEEIIQKIEEEGKLVEILQEAKENPKELEKIIGKEDSKKILDLLRAQKQKKIVIKKEIFLINKKPNGVSLIKSILKNLKDVEIRYLSAGKYSLKLESENIKEGHHKLKEIIKDLEKESKKQDFEFSVKEK